MEGKKVSAIMLTSYPPLKSAEIEAADIVSSSVTLFRAIATASPPAVGIATATLRNMVKDIAEDKDDPEFQEPLLRHLENTMETIVAVVAAHLGVKGCDGDCDNCDKKPETETDECYSPDSKKPWS
jgi:hypothetical protein